MHIRFAGADACRWLHAGTVAAVLLLTLSAPYFSLAQDNNASNAAKAPASNAEHIARGKYIVNGLAACADCHTPRDKNGELDRTRWLQGAPVFFQPAQAVPGWAIVAPRLAGLLPGRDAEAITLLTTGVWSDGKPPKSPMPRFHMTRSDAEAVLAYLKSL